MSLRLVKKIILLLVLVSCETKNQSALVPKDFDLKLRNTPEAILLDVRTEKEVSEGTLPGAQNIVYDNSFDEKLAGLSKEAPIFVYCAKGGRSEKAAAIMKEKGFKEVYSLDGGIVAWREAKMPTTSK